MLNTKELREKIHQAENAREVMEILKENGIDLDKADARVIFWLTHRKERWNGEVCAAVYGRREGQGPRYNDGAGGVSMWWG